MVFLASLFSQLLVAAILLIAVGLGGAVAYFYVQARRREADEAEREAREIEQRDSELSHIRQRIEEIYERQQTGSETQFARVDQQLEELQSHLDAKGRQIDGVQGQLRYDLKRHEDEIAELRNQLREAIEVFAAAALPAARPSAPALEAHAEPTPEPKPSKPPQSIIYAPKSDEAGEEPSASSSPSDALKDDHELLDDLFGSTDLDAEDEPDTEAELATPEVVEVNEPEEVDAPEVKAEKPDAGRSFVTRDVVDLTAQTEPRDDLAFVEIDGSAPRRGTWDDDTAPEAESALDADAEPDETRDEHEIVGDEEEETKVFSVDEKSDDDAVSPPPVQWAALDEPVLEEEPEVDVEAAAESSTSGYSDPFEVAAAETDTPQPQEAEEADAAIPAWGSLSDTVIENEEPAEDDSYDFVEDTVAADPPSLDPTESYEDATDDAFANAEVELEDEASSSVAKVEDEVADEEESVGGFEDTFNAMETGSPFDPFGMEAEDELEALPAHSGDGMRAPDFEADPFSDPATEYHPEPKTDLDSLAEPPSELGDELAFYSSELDGMEPTAETASHEAEGNEEDLTVLTVVDEPMQQKLYALGITTIEAIARWSRSDARRIANQLTHTSEEDIMDRWVFEAQSVLFERYQNELRGQREQRLNAN